MTQGIVVGMWNDKVGIDVVTEYPVNYREESGVSDATLLDLFNERIVQQTAGYDLVTQGGAQVAIYYTPFTTDELATDTGEPGFNHGIVFLFLDGARDADLIKEQFIEFSLFLFKLINKDDFPELFFNIIDNFAFLEPITDEQRYAALYTDPAREHLLKELGEGSRARSDLESWYKDTFGNDIVDLNGLLAPFLKTGLLKQGIETIKGKKKETFYFLVRDVYLFKIPPKKIMSACKKGRDDLFAPFREDYCEDVAAFFEDYELTPTEINKLSVLLAIPNLYKIICLLRESAYELDEFRVDFLDRYNYMPSNFSYLLKLLEKNDVLNVYKAGDKKILVLKTDIQFHVFFPEYLVDNIRKAWRENRIDKHLAIKHLTLLRDEYLDNFIKINGQARQKKGPILDLDATTSEIAVEAPAKGRNAFIQRLEHVLLKA